MKQAYITLFRLNFLKNIEEISCPCLRDRDMWTVCNKDNNNDPDLVPVLTYFTCKIDGETFARDTLDTPADNLVEGQLDLKFTNGNRSLILGSIDFTETEGTFELNWVHYRNGSLDYYGDSGTLIITEINIEQEYNSGTFTASCTPLGGGTEVQITEGEFVMEYIDM